MTKLRSMIFRAFFLALILALTFSPAPAHFVLGPYALVEAGDTVISVPGYSVPSFVRWDGDDLPDLVVGEGGGGVPEGRVRIYLNTGSLASPQFDGFFYAQSEGADLVGLSSG